MLKLEHWSFGHPIDRCCHNPEYSSFERRPAQSDTAMGNKTNFFQKIDVHTGEEDSQTYAKVNGFLGHLGRGNYLKYDAVKSFVDSIINIDIETVKNDLLSGL